MGDKWVGGWVIGTFVRGVWAGGAEFCEELTREEGKLKGSAFIGGACVGPPIVAWRRWVGG